MMPTCIRGADQQKALEGYDEQIALHAKDADLTYYDQLVNGRANVANREICTGTEVSNVVIVAVQTKSDQQVLQAAAPTAVLAVEKPVLLVNEVVSEIVVEPADITNMVKVAGFADAIVEVQIENEDGVTEWIALDPSTSNLLPIGLGTKNFKVRITPRDGSQQIFEKTIEVSRLATETQNKTFLPADASSESTDASTSDDAAGIPIVYVFIFLILVLLILALVVRSALRKRERL